MGTPILTSIEGDQYELDKDGAKAILDYVISVYLKEPTIQALDQRLYTEIEVRESLKLLTKEEA